ncbi:MAG: PilZ domain-containing protein [bacterium]
MNKKFQRLDHNGVSLWRKVVKRNLHRLGIRTRNQRRFPRFECTLPVEIHLDTPGQVSIINAVAQNVSAGGMLVKCSAVLDALTACHVSFRIPDWFPGASRTKEVMMNARVLHANVAGLTFGIAFNQPL